MRKKNRFARFGSWLRKSNPLVSSAIMVVIALIGTYIVLGPVELGWIKDFEFRPTPLESNRPFYEMFFLAVIMAPLIETFLFQTIPFFVLHRFRIFRTHRWAMVLIPALIFGSLHYYSVAYIFAAVIAGCVLMYLYIVKWKRHAYWNVVLFHAIWNLLGISLDALDKGGLFG